MADRHQTLGRPVVAVLRRRVSRTLVAFGSYCVVSGISAAGVGAWVGGQVESDGRWLSVACTVAAVLALGVLCGRLLDDQGSQRSESARVRSDDRS